MNRLRIKANRLFIFATPSGSLSVRRSVIVIYAMLDIIDILSNVDRI